MTFYPNQSGVEVGKGLERSNLSPKARLVADVLRQYITPSLRNEGLVALANEIAEQNLASDDPRVVNFGLELKALESEILVDARAAGATPEQTAVITNFCSKLAGNMRNQSPTETPTAP